MRRRRISTLSCVTAILVGLGAQRAAPADEVRRVLVSEFRPTQVEVGKEFALHAFVDGWKQEAAAAGLSLKEFAPRLRERYRHKRVPVVIAPDGAVRNLDMHHRIFALREVERLTGVGLDLGIEVKRDYRGQSFGDYARDFVEVRRFGYFGPSAPASAEAKMRLLPESFDALRDNPLRATVGHVLENVVGIDPDGMVVYYEFPIAELLLRRGIAAKLRARGIPATRRGVKAGTALRPDVVSTVRAAIFHDEKVADLVLRSSLDPRRAEVKAVLAREAATAGAAGRTVADAAGHSSALGDAARRSTRRKPGVAARPRGGARPGGRSGAAATRR